MSAQSQTTGPAIFLDPCWLAALDFARRHIAPGDTLAAPVEFAFHFPQALACGQFHPGRTANPQWMVFHKDYREGLAGFDFESLATEYTPVWANEVFTIFQLRASHRPVTGHFLRRLSSRIKPFLPWRNGQLGTPLGHPRHRSHGHCHDHP